MRSLDYYRLALIIFIPFTRKMGAAWTSFIAMKQFIPGLKFGPAATIFSPSDEQLETAILSFLE